VSPPTTIARSAGGGAALIVAGVPSCQACGGRSFSGKVRAAPGTWAWTWSQTDLTDFGNSWPEVPESLHIGAYSHLSL